MCTVGPETNIDEADLQRRLQDTAVTTPQQVQTPVPDQSTGPTADQTDGNPGSTKTGIAGGGDKGMGPNPDDPYGGNGPPAGGDPQAGATGTTPPAATGTTATPSTYAPNSDGSFNGQSYIDAHPDVLAEYNRLTTTADRNSPWFTEHGLDQGPTGFAQWHANNGGYSTSGSGTPAAGGGTAGAGTANDVLTNLTTSFNDTIKGLQDSTAAQIAALNNNSTSLTSQIAGMQKGFATSQQELLDNMNKAAATQSKSFTDALKNLSGASGQASKKPNYGRALQRNKDLNGQGIGATMLTGPNGVAPGGVSLGTTSLLGA